MPAPNEVAEEMARLAASVARNHPELDGSFATLPLLEALVVSARECWDEEAMTRFGAYFGETLRRVAEPPAHWVDFDTAASEAPAVADLGRGPDLEAMLRSDDRYVFPLAKVQKFVNQGACDSLAAFAPIALMILRPRQAQARRSVDPDKINPKGIELIDAFLAAPSVSSVKRLDGCGSLIREDAIKWVLARRELRSEMFFGLFAERAEGRGYAKFDPGMAAARWMWCAIDAGSLDEDTTLAEARTLLRQKNTLVRKHAAWVLARSAFKRQQEAFVEGMYERGDTAVRLGVVGAYTFHVSDAVMGYDSYPSVEPHAALILAAVQGPAAVRKSVAATLQQVAGRVRVSITAVLPAVTHLLERGKPAEVVYALDALMSHVYSIKHGRAQWSEALDRCVQLAIAHTSEDVTKAKTTKTRIAASYVMRALSSLGEALPARHAAKVEAATLSVSGVR